MVALLERRLRAAEPAKLAEEAVERTAGRAVAHAPVPLAALIHIGMDTVKLNGEGFEALVAQGDHVLKGTPLMQLDFDYIRDNAPSIVTPVLCTELQDNQRIEVLSGGEITSGDPLFAVKTIRK